MLRISERRKFAKENENGSEEANSEEQVDELTIRSK